MSLLCGGDEYEFSLISYTDTDLVEIDDFTENEEAIIMCQI